VNQSPSCPLCREIVATAPIVRGKLIVHHCPRCGLHFGEDEVVTATGDVGSVDTSPHHFSTLLNELDALRAAFAELMDRRWPYFTERLGAAPRHWLEIGPGNGLLSDVVTSRGGTWRGCEIDLAMATEMAGRGLDVVHGDFATMDARSLFTPAVADQGGFDVIFFSQVLEHVRSPDRFLENAVAALRPGGMIYVDVPSDDGLTATVRRLNKWGQSYGEVVPPYHMIAYSGKTLRYALTNAGFDDVSVASWSYNDPTFGLAHARIHSNPKLRAVWRASALLSRGGNLVGIARKPEGNGAGSLC
jgi:SAM-dependent methyltransferase